MIFRDEWKEAVGVEAWRGPLLLKLHGSSNWITSYLQYDWENNRLDLIQQLRPDIFYVFESGSRPYPTYGGRYMPDYEEFSYGYYPPNIQGDLGKSAPPGRVFIRVRPKWPWMPRPTSEESGLMSMPLIIPPVKQKSYDLFGTLFSMLWQKAEDFLVSANHIIIIGYSFPRTDHKSISLFINAFSKRGTMPLVTIIDPYPERAVEVFRSTLGITSDKLHVCREPYSATFDVEKLLI
jgi:hypothetical protein